MFSLVANIQYKNTDGFSIIKVHQSAGILPTIMPEASNKFLGEAYSIRDQR